MDWNAETSIYWATCTGSDFWYFSTNKWKEAVTELCGTEYVKPWLDYDMLDEM